MSLVLCIKQVLEVDAVEFYYDKGQCIIMVPVGLSTET